MKNIFLILVCISVSFNILAESSRQKDSHEHGAAILKMALEGEKLQIEFEVPSESLIGFEHFPKSQSNRENFSDAIKILSDPSRLFSTISSSFFSPASSMDPASDSEIGRASCRERV